MAASRGCDNACHEVATREELSRLTLHDVDAYMKQRAGSLRRISLKTVAGKMRSFLRWLHPPERTNSDLSPTVIAPSIYAREGIPCAIGAEDVKRVLAVTQDDQTAKGLRDYAILTPLSTYGVRAGEITALRLDDVDWRKATVRIRHSETGATTHLPLLPEVGKAVLRLGRGVRVRRARWAGPGVSSLKPVWNWARR